MIKNNTNKIMGIIPFGLSLVTTTEVAEAMLVILGIIATAISIALSIRNFVERVRNEKNYKEALEELQKEIEQESKKWK